MSAPASDARRQLDDFLDRFEPAVADRARAVLAAVRKLVPGATELVYDAYNALSIGFGKGERLSDCFLHVAVYPRHVNLGFNHGAELPDPARLLAGDGSRIRHVRIDDPARVRDADVARLVQAAAAHMGFAPRPGARGPLLIKRVYATQRPRRPAQAGAIRPRRSNVSR